MITPNATLYEQLGRPPWTDEAVIRALREHRIRRILPRDQQAFVMNCTLSEVPASIIGKIREEGIVVDLGNGDKTC